MKNLYLWISIFFLSMLHAHAAEILDEGVLTPLANWTGKQIYAYMKEHDLPFHPLWEKGFTSIGCEPCTTLPSLDGGERSGRWAGLDKKECGIHTFMEKKG
jgi:phosphoadenosine phosphosulfate reductase